MDEVIDALPSIIGENAPYISFDEEKRAQFLLKFAETGRHEESALYAGVSYETMRQWRKNHPDFALAFQAADRKYREKLRTEIERRGVHGWLEPVYSQGQRALEPVLDAEGRVQYDGDGRVVQVPASIRKFSDSLLLALAKRQDPEFRERSEISVGSPSEATLEAASTAVVKAELGKLSDEGRLRLRQVLEEISGGRDSVSSSDASTSTVREITSSTSTEDGRGPSDPRPASTISVGEGVVEAELVGPESRT